MEKRIKTLCIVTMIAIVAFLCLQSYWLYGQYRYTFTQCEKAIESEVVEVFTEYNNIRTERARKCMDDIRHQKLSISQTFGDSVETTRKLIVSTYKFKAQELLGLPDTATITPEMKQQVVDMLSGTKDLESDDKVYDCSTAPSENAAWTASQNIHTETYSPFSSAEMDSSLLAAGIEAKINLITTDSMVWARSAEPKFSLIHPQITFRIPYSELQCKSVEIICPVSVLHIFSGMIGSLSAIAVVSVLLIICLVWLFSTVVKLNRLDRMRNDFVTTMIHELKRPISTLKMCVSGIENERMMSDTTTKSQLLGETRRALDNLSAYFAKLRDLAFNKVDQIPLNIESLCLRQLVDDVASRISLPTDKVVSIKNEIDPQLLVMADGSHLCNIINNLVENAVKYSGREVDIRLEAGDSAAGVEIRISDSGIGIAPSELPHLFDRFYRGSASATELPGMGLGLTYVKLLVDAHGGTISVSSRQGHGTTFTIFLPQ